MEYFEGGDLRPPTPQDMAWLIRLLRAAARVSAAIPQVALRNGSKCRRWVRVSVARARWRAQAVMLSCAGAEITQGLSRVPVDKPSLGEYLSRIATAPQEYGQENVLGAG